MMINFSSLYNSLPSELSDNQKKLSINSSLSVYYGLSKDGYFRLAFLSKAHAPKMDSTKLLRVTQGEESEGVFWTCFDLMQPDAKRVFFTFCSNLVESIEGTYDEAKALRALKKRYITWKAMFRREVQQKTSMEILLGLFGELYFLKKYMIPQYGADIAVKSWSGPESTSKDFSVNTAWYEVKTIGASTDRIHISSLAQLSSEHPGHLVIIKAERMSEQFDNGEACIGALFSHILSLLNDEGTEEIFLAKLRAHGFDVSDVNLAAKFDVKSIRRYRVADTFPRLTEADISYPEICDVTYSIFINSLNDYMED